MIRSDSVRNVIREKRREAEEAFPVQMQRMRTGQEVDLTKLSDFAGMSELGTGSTLLHAAAKHARDELLREVLANPDFDDDALLCCSDSSGSQPVHMAAAHGNGTTLRVLSRYKEARNDTNGQRPLHVAAQQGKVEALKVLLELKADIDAADGEGRTALMLALGSVEAEKCMKILIDAGANHKILDLRGYTAINIAEESESPALRASLLARISS